ncbi:MAG: alkyl sulfatase dimerization domain-containing protein, partial [Actinomycetota bacterium]
LVCAHGPPMSGADRIRTEATDYRDSIQFLWDQTVRGINRGLSTDELTSFVQLPDHFADSWLTRQWYGLAEHHVRQIHNGLRGWFDSDETKLLPLPPVERCRRLVAGFGGADQVRVQARAALDDLDLRWALELAGWLVRLETDDRGRADAGTPEDRRLLASVLREIAQRTTASNIRDWCLTRALELEGELDLSRHRRHRFAAGAVMSAGPAATIHALRVLVDPDEAGRRTEHLRFVVGEEACGLRLRNGVAVPTDGAGAELEVSLDHRTLAALMADKTTLSKELASGAVSTESPDGVASFLACFDHAGLRG